MNYQEIKDIVAAGLPTEHFSAESVEEVSHLLALHYPDHTVALLNIHPTDPTPEPAPTPEPKPEPEPESESEAIVPELEPETP